MKRLILTVIFLTLVLTMTMILSSCAKPNKYIIQDADGNVYRTDAYVRGTEGCITFSYGTGCGCSEDEEHLSNATICGSYTIEENSNFIP